MKYVVKILTEHRDKLNELYVREQNQQKKRMETLAKVVEINHVLDMLKLLEAFEENVNTRLTARLKLLGWKAPSQCKE